MFFKRYLFLFFVEDIKKIGLYISMVGFLLDGSTDIIYISMDGSQMRAQD